MTRTLTIAALATLGTLVAAPLDAQQAKKPAAKHDHAMADDKDPTRKVAGAGLPAGWQARFDKPDAVATNVKFVSMGDGFHFTSGPAAIYWKPSDRASGNYTVTATLTQTKAPTHPEAYGLFVGGQNLQSPNESYVYLLVRGDGKVMVKHRANATDVHTILDWTEVPAVHKADAAGKATNQLSIAVARDSVRMFVNGSQVWAKDRAYMGDMAGFYGYRVNHNLDVHAGPITLRK